MKKGLKKTKISYIAFVMVLIISFCSMVGCTQNDTKSQSEGSSEETSTTISTINEDEKVYVSLKETFEYLGGTFSIEGGNSTAKKDKDIVKVDENSKEAYLNSNKIVMSDVPKVKNDDLYVPIDFLTQVVDARVNFDSEKNSVNIRKEMSLKYTKGFKVEYLKGGMKKITDADKRTIILVAKGKEVPEEYKNDIIINTPIDNVLIASTTQGCMLRALDEIPSIIGVTTKQDQWQINGVADAMKNGKIQYVGQNTAPDYEKISSLKPSITFMYSGPSGLHSMMKKYDELNLKYAANNEYLEEDPLGRMEWMKFISAFYDKEELAEKIFNDAVNKVNDTKNKVANIKKPKVAWGMVSKGKVYVPKPNSYVEKMIEIAGGEYVFKDSDVGNGNISLEEFYAKAKDADILMYSSLNQYTPTLKDMLDQAPILEDAKPIKDKQVWCFSPDYYQSIDKTDELVTDLAAIFHSKEYGGYNVKHYIKYTE